MSIMDINDNWIYFSIIIIIFLIYIFSNKETTPIVKQINDYGKEGWDRIVEKVNDRPFYGKLPVGYTGTAYTGQSTMKGGVMHEEIVEQICPMGTYINNLEFGTSNGFINYIKGNCSDGSELDMLGKKFTKSKRKNIKEQHGINGVNIKYNSSYLQNISQIEKGIEDAGKKIHCGPNHIIVGYRGRAENPNYDEEGQISDFRIKHLQFICNDKNAEKNIPITHGKCGNDGEVCEFNMNNEYIYYGIPGKKVVKINKKDIKSNQFTCRPQGFFGIKGDVLPVEDPLPGMDKSCYLERRDYKFDYKDLLDKMRYRLWGAWSNIDHDQPLDLDS
jgi:hypothetical protein